MKELDIWHPSRTAIIVDQQRPSHLAPEHLIEDFSSLNQIQLILSATHTKKRTNPNCTPSNNLESANRKELVQSFPQ